MLTKKPDDKAYTNDYVNKALDELKAEGVDVVRRGLQADTVTLNDGGA